MSGVGHALGVRLGPDYLATRIGQVGPRGAEWGRVGPVRAEWGWGGVGHALGFNYMTARLGPGCKGRVGPVRAEWGRVGPVRVEWGWGGVGHALGFN